jgi:hypothetical protein
VWARTATRSRRSTRSRSRANRLGNGRPGPSRRPLPGYRAWCRRAGAQARRGCQPIGVKSVLIAPMLWEGKAIGAIFIGRASVGEFSEKETRLLKTFADQAVIAIHNARLFHAERAMRRYRLLVWIDHTASPAPSLARSQAPAQARCSAAQPSDGVDAFSGTRGPGSPGQEPHVQRLCSAATNSTWR